LHPNVEVYVEFERNRLIAKPGVCCPEEQEIAPKDKTGKKGDCKNVNQVLDRPLL
jgi:hypothetical protein